MLIGLAGRAGVGKTTIANMLRDQDGFVVKTYAYPLKKSLSELTGLPMEYFTDSRLKELPCLFDKSPRQLMQIMGTEFVRGMIHPDFWTWRMRQTLDEVSSDVNVVIDDCRFENETHLIRELGGMIIHLDRYYDPVTRELAHASEQTLRIMPTDTIIQSLNHDENYTYDLVKGVLECE